MVFLLTYGGGLVGGDVVRLSISIEASTRLTLLTQGSTKVFKAPRPNVDSAQRLDVVVKGEAALAYLPDPVQPFGESVYEQTQIFRLDQRQGSICVLDWVCDGRPARGEKWDLWSWRGRNEVWTSNGADLATKTKRLLLRDNVILHGGVDTANGTTLQQRMEGLGAIGTLIVYGKVFDNLASFFLQEFSSLPRMGVNTLPCSADGSDQSAIQRWRNGRHAREKADVVWWTAASVRGCIVVKFGALNVEGGRRWLRDMLREEGTLEREFGEQSLLCLK